MDAVSALATVQRIQAAFALFATVQVDLWPLQCEVQNGSVYDYIIVGAGAAGCVLANRLTEDNNIRVLLIEAGGDPHYESIQPGNQLSLANTDMDYNYTAEYAGTCFRKSRYPLTIGKVLGGSSSINELIYGRGVPRVFQQWYEASNDSRWLYENVIPYYKKSEELDVVDRTLSNTKFYGTQGHIHIKKVRNQAINKYLKAFENVGNPIVPDYSETVHNGYSLALQTTDGQFRQTAANTYLKVAKDRPNLCVRKNTLVSKVVFDKNKNAVGVEALLENGKVIYIKAKNEVIISAGAIKSPQLLMLSGIGPKKHLRSHNIKVISDLPVGEKLKEQVGVLVVHKTEKLERPSLFNPSKYRAPVFLGYASLNKSQYNSDYVTCNIVQTNLEFMLRYCTVHYGLRYDICDNIYKLSEGREVLFSLIVNLNTRSNGQVLLRSREPTDSPKVTLGIYSNDEDLKNTVAYVKDFMKVEDSSYFKKEAQMIDPICTQCGRFKKGSTKYWRCYAQCMKFTIGNYAGTCAMGSVVNGKLYVRGVNRLRVVDSSVMPVAAGATNYISTIMVAEKAADMIKNRN